MMGNILINVRRYLWWLVLYDEPTHTATRAIGVVGVEGDDRALAWMGQARVAELVDGRTGRVSVALDPDGVVPVAAAGAEMVLALVRVERPVGGSLEDAVQELAAAGARPTSRRGRAWTPI